jgi:hypothetical protein
MIDSLFNATVSALCYSLLEPAYKGTEPNTGVLNQVADFALGQHSRMPDFLRLPFKLVCLFFVFETFILSGTLFHRQTLAWRRSRIQSWKNSKLSPKRDFIKFFDSLAWLSWYGFQPQESASPASLNAK